MVEAWKSTMTIRHKRIVIVAGPRCGKSFLAQQISEGTGIPVYCADPLSKVKEPMLRVNYLPEGLEFDGDHGAAAYVAATWFEMPGPWIAEGHVMARALRRWKKKQDELQESLDGFPEPEPPCDLIYVFENQREDCDLLPGQVAMHKGVMRVWSAISDHYEEITVYL